MKDSFVVWVGDKVKGDEMAGVYHALPQEPGKPPAKSYCCGISHRKVIVSVITPVLVTIIVIYALYQPSASEKMVTPIHHLLGDNTRSDYNKPRHRLPQCIIIGMRKGGTRALLAYLGQHPDIQISGKEVHYFDRKDNYFQGISWYKKHLPLSYGDQITIEKTPAYFHDKDTPERIFQMNSTIKLILVVREPLDRAVSDHLQLMDKRTKKGLETYDFEEKALNGEGEVNENYRPIKRSVYHDYMKRWLSFFSMDQILIVDGGKLIKNPHQVVQTVETFLGLEHKISKESFVFDRTKGFYCIKNETTGHKCLNKSKGRKHPEIDKGVSEKLKAYFEPNNKIFFQQIGQTFDW